MSAQSELLKDFLLESFENLSLMNADLDKLSSKEFDYEVINSIYRAVHTLKGAANLLNFNRLQEITHSVENLLDYMRSEKIQSTEKVRDLLQRFSDMCNDCLKHIENHGEESTKTDFSTLRAEVVFTIEQSLANHSINKENIYSSLPQDVQMNLSTSSNSSSLDLDDFEDRLEKLIESPALSVSQEPSHNSNGVKSSEDNTEEPGIQKSITDSSIRVNVQLLDKIMNRVGELVLNRNQILQCISSLREPELDRLTQQLNVITTELQADIMTTRMQPIGNTLTKFERMVRDFSRESGKKIRFKIEGQDTELDKSLLESIKDPLTHIVRNSIDHGLETSEERVSSGKIEEGTLMIRAYHESGQVTVEVSDDGRGIDVERVRQKAIEKNLVASDKINQYSHEDILQLIFKPGFSTAEKVTKISGRGVGMDVVKTNIEKIGGSVSISSKKGKGTEIKLKIPLTLAIVPALIIESSRELFAIPQINIVELVRFEGEKNEAIEKIDTSEFIRLRGNLIPVFRINQTLGLDVVSSKSNEFRHSLDNSRGLNSIDSIGSKSHSQFEADSVNIVILNAEGKLFGIIVDAIMDTEEIVVKPLDRHLKDLKYFAGATIMGNGHVALIVDALGFYNGIDTSGISEEAISKELISNTIIDHSETHENILVKLSDDRIYGIPLSLIHRLEEFKPSALEKVGDHTIVRYDEKPMILIDLENALGLSKNNILKNKTDENNVKVIVIKMRGHSYGFAVKEIIDTATTNNKIDSDIVDRPGLLGAIFIDNQVVTLIDIFSVVDSLGLVTAENSEGGEFHYKPVKNKGVLVVDDSPVYRKMEENLFNEYGFKIFIANNGEEGLKILKEHVKEIDIVLTDIEMPVMDGFELSKNIRANSQLKHLPVIAVSTRVSQAFLDKGIEAGFNIHLEKFKKYDVLDAVYRQLGVKV